MQNMPRTLTASPTLSPAFTTPRVCGQPAFLAALAVVACLLPLLVGAPAFAGSYTRVYTGGSVSPAPFRGSAAYVESNGTYGKGAGVQVVGSCSCSGKITATFT